MGEDTTMDQTPIAPGLLSLLAARERVWQDAGFPGSQIAPSLDVLTLALNELAVSMQQATATFQAFLDLYAQHRQEFLVLQARERREHQPVRGRVTFARPVRGVVSFTAPHHP
jgi:hypothetical protein